MKYDPNDLRPMEIQIIRNEVQEIHNRRIKAGVTNYLPEAHCKLFTIHTADKWLQLERGQPAPNMLFGNFWYEDELCILFADTNMGKSILAVQLGNSISRNEPIEPFELHAPKANVLYIDFELSSKQFMLRYEGRQGPFAFNTSFFRAEFNPATIVPPDYKDYTDYLNAAIEDAIRQTKATVLIIDNITCLHNGTERAGEALWLMQHLKALKTKHKLSILVLAHTPKRRPGIPIGRNDMQGSKMLMNFADSAFAIGESYTRPGYRYLKQVKQRSSAEVYGAQNVCVCRLDDKLNFLRYIFTANANEMEHLRRYNTQYHEHLHERIRELGRANFTQRQIAEELKIGLATVNRILKDGI